MITPDKATSIISDHVIKLSSQAIPLSDSLGYTLCESITADRNIPPFARVAMDGIAISLKAFLDGRTAFECEYISRAGEPRYRLKDPEHCVQVMTGGVLPENSDCVIPYEMTQEKDHSFLISPDLKLKPMLNVHLEGSDARAGEILISKDCLIKPPHIGVLASVGKTAVNVYQKPVIGILSTGDELVDISEKPLTHQIRKSNTSIMHTLLRKMGFNCHLDHVPDHTPHILSVLKACRQKSDILILSGGVSKGKFDLIPEALADLGMKTLFHRIAQRPGKPMLFGIFENPLLPVFGLPGNPVSTLVCFYRYVLPYLNLLEMRPTFNHFVKLGETYEFKKSLTCFLPVTLNIDSATGATFGHPVTGHGSGDYVSLCQSDGFLELDAGTDIFEKGTIHPFYAWKTF